MNVHLNGAAANNIDRSSFQPIAVVEPKLTCEDWRHDAQRGPGINYRIHVNLGGEGAESHVLDHHHASDAPVQWRFAGDRRMGHRLECYSREVLTFRDGVGYVQGLKAAHTGLETPLQFLVHHFGVLVCGQHRAFLSSIGAKTYDKHRNLLRSYL